MPDQTIRAVFDCNLFVQAFLNPAGAAARCFDLTRSDKVQLFISPETLSEVTEVLSRPAVRSLLPHASAQQIESFLEDIIATATYLREVPEKFRFERDPKDAPYLNLSIAAAADYLVTRDQDLLDLMTGHTNECKEFRQRFRNVRIVDPQEFLMEVQAAA